jgi:hypothetical protein
VPLFDDFPCDVAVDLVAERAGEAVAKAREHRLPLSRINPMMTMDMAITPKWSGVSNRAGMIVLATPTASNTQPMEIIQATPGTMSLPMVARLW